MGEKKSIWMKDPKCYMMLKEKADGIKLGMLKFPILFADTIYLLPSEAGEQLVKDGYAIERKPQPFKEYVDAQQQEPPVARGDLEQKTAASPEV